MASIIAPLSTSALPKTEASATFITLSDLNSQFATPTMISFTFPQVMTADPLTSVGDDGSEPDNKSPWWPFFQGRHKLSGLYWVQGHMLNHNVHGPGTTNNLVPISNTLNTNMSAMVEELVKKMVNQGKILRYVVQAHWDGFKASGALGDMVKHPEAMRKIYGIHGVDADGALLWGEQFAPTRLSWEVWEYTDWNLKTLKPIALSRYGGDASQWNNNFPGKAIY
jgi:hypothetical protein